MGNAWRFKPPEKVKAVGSTSGDRGDVSFPIKLVISGDDEELGHLHHLEVVLGDGNSRRNGVFCFQVDMHHHGFGCVVGDVVGGVPPLKLVDGVLQLARVRVGAVNVAAIVESLTYFPGWPVTVIASLMRMKKQSCIILALCGTLHVMGRRGEVLEE